MMLYLCKTMKSLLYGSIILYTVIHLDCIEGFIQGKGNMVLHFCCCGRISGIIIHNVFLYKKI